MNNPKNKWLATPYIIWMIGFTIIPLALIVYYGLTDKSGAFTLANVLSICLLYTSKRVIGLPGDVIDIHDGGVYLNGSETPLEEPYLKEPMDTSDPEYPLHFEVPEGCYFMMGDNRNDSWDARFWENTWVTEDKLVAKVLFRYFPFNKMGLIK